MNSSTSCVPSADVLLKIVKITKIQQKQEKGKPKRKPRKLTTGEGREIGY